jgi:hypothetical protein
VIEDMHSANGIRVDGEQVEKAELAPGAAIVLGRVRMVFRCEAAGAAGKG